MSALSIYGGFCRRLRQIQYTLRNGDNALASSVISRRDCARLYSGSFLEAVVAFELSIECLFVDCLTGKCSHPRGYKTIVTCANGPLAYRLIKHKSSYVDWLPPSRSEEIAKVFFVDGKNPFEGFQSNVGNEVQKCLYIRNYIAHKSGHSEVQFRRHVVGATVLPPNDRDAFGYFRYSHAAGVTKIEYHLGELQRAMHWLCH